MPLFLHVHDAPGISAEEVRQAHLRDIPLGRSRNVDYLRYWVDSDAGKFFCLVEAPTALEAEAVHAAGHGMLPDEVYRVREGLRNRRDYEAMRVLSPECLRPMPTASTLDATAASFSRRCCSALPVASTSPSSRFWSSAPPWLINSHRLISARLRYRVGPARVVLCTYPTVRVTSPSPRGRAQPRSHQPN